MRSKRYALVTARNVRPRGGRLHSGGGVELSTAAGVTRPGDETAFAVAPVALPETAPRPSIGGAGISFAVLVLGALALLLAGGALRATTQAFFVTTQSAASNSFTTAAVSLTTPVVTAFTVSNLVPGDFQSRTVQVTNGSGVSVNTFLTIWADTSSALDSNTSGLQLVAFRCLSAGGLPVTCGSATQLQTVVGVMNQASATTIATSGVPATSSVSVSGTNLVVSSTSVAGVPVLTKNNPNTQGLCSVGNDGGCPLGGYSSVAVSSPATSVTVSGKTISTPAMTNGAGLGTTSGTNADDYLLLYTFLPSNANETTFKSQTSSLSLAFTAVQPSGAVNPSR